MTGHIRLIRPAGAAIAAVLAFQSTPTIAQVIVPPPVSPAPAVADPVAAPAPTTPQVEFRPTAPVVQQIAPVEERIAAATAAADAERIQRSVEKPASTARAEPKSNANSVTAPAPVPAPVAPQEQVSADAARAAPIPPNVTAQSAQSAAGANVSPAAISASDPGTQQSLLWALGGGALVLLGLGGAALARLRRSGESDEADTTADGVVHESVMADSSAISSPAYVAAHRVPMAAGRDADTLEEMVAAPPSADNPFATRSKRLRRAKFLLSQQASSRAPERHMPPQTTHAEPAFAATADRSQTVYRFGADSGRQGFFKTQTR